MIKAHNVPIVIAGNKKLSALSVECISLCNLFFISPIFLSSQIVQSKLEKNAIKYAIELPIERFERSTSLRKKDFSYVIIKD